MNAQARVNVLELNPAARQQPQAVERVVDAASPGEARLAIRENLMEGLDGILNHMAPLMTYLTKRGLTLQSQVVVMLTTIFIARKIKPKDFETYNIMYEELEEIVDKYVMTEHLNDVRAMPHVEREAVHEWHVSGTQLGATFDMGVIEVSESVTDKLNTVTIDQLLMSHGKRIWGMVNSASVESNEEVLKSGLGLVFSIWGTKESGQVVVVTAIAHDRRLTQVLTRGEDPVTEFFIRKTEGAPE